MPHRGPRVEPSVMEVTKYEGAHHREVVPGWEGWHPPVKLPNSTAMALPNVDHIADGPMEHPWSTIETYLGLLGGSD